MSRVIFVFLLSISVFACALKPAIHEGNFFTPERIYPPKGYSVLYFYRAQDPWTAQVITRTSFNHAYSLKLGDSTYTRCFLPAGQYDISTEPWGVKKHILLKAGETYYLQLSVETELVLKDKQHTGTYAKKTEIVRYIFKNKTVAMMDLAGCRYVKGCNDRE
jgi:hypothetical protein